MNVIIIMGRLGGDPESRSSQSGTTVTKFNVATDRYNGPDREKTTDWHRVVAFGRLGELCAQYLSKGSQCCVRGSVKYSRFEKTDGSVGYSTDVMADDVRFLGGGSRSGAGEEKPAPVSESDMPF